MAVLHLVTADHDAAPSSARADDLVMATGAREVAEPGAGFVVAAVADAHPGADAVFGDVLHDGRHVRRSGWSPTRALTDPAALMPLAVRVATLRRLGLGAGDGALALALAAAGADVVHVPTPLTRHDQPMVAAGEPAVIAARLATTGWPMERRDGPRPGTARLRPRGRRPAVSVVIPTAGTRHGATVLVARCVASLAGALGADDEVLLVIGDEFVGDPDAVADGAGVRVIVVRRPSGAFNYSVAVNQGILTARHDAVLVLNDDTDHPSPGLLDALTAHLADPSVSAVGAQLRYPDGRLQHAGIVIDDARPLHSFVGADPSALARHGADVAHDVIAATGACLLLRRSAALAVGGLSTEFPLSFGDVDLCLRLRRRGGRVVFEPDAVMTHHEGASREPHIDRWEWDRWIRRWGAVEDPWYHPGHHRPDDPDHLHRNADHLDPLEPFSSPIGRDTRIRPHVHHARLT